MMESLLKDWDGESVIIRYDRPTDAWIFIAIHSSGLGPATGGTRMKQYVTQIDALQDALKLSASMTNKFAVPGFNNRVLSVACSTPALSPSCSVGR